MKAGQEENKNEFIPGLINNPKTNERKNNFLPSKEIKNFSVSPVSTPVTTQENLDINLKKNITFSFRKNLIEKTKTIDPIKPKLIQAIYRGYIYRKNFFKLKGIKEKLKAESDIIIQQKETEYIPENIKETEKIINKEFNDDFLDKLKIKNNKNINGNIPRKKLGTDCLIGKDKNGEEFLYKGELDLNGKFNGYGELYLKSGKKYEGKFSDGKLNDYGRLIDLFGIKCYEGKFKDNQLTDGKGKIIEIKEDGSKTVYEGFIKNMRKEGNGIEIKNDYTYMGEFINDLKHGKGKVVFKDGETFYQGEFTYGKMTGSGVYYHKDKSRYEGEFLDGKMHGKGLFIWPDGTEYEGNYVNNLREGSGEYRKKNGKIYRGMYKAGKQHGKGIIINEFGEKKEVEYNEGKIVKKIDNEDEDKEYNKQFTKQGREFTLK